MSNLNLLNIDNKILPDFIKEIEHPIIVSDPPFNMNYHYKEYKDNKPEDEYFEWLAGIFNLCPSVVIHYPESLYKLSIKMGKSPDKVVSWTYNSNLPRQHRDIAYFGIKPDFSLMKQPYKNPNDKRIKARIEKTGIKGCRLYDWWNINQVKNINKVKTKHPCQMPLEVMKNCVGIIPNNNVTIIDPFMGSGTTAVACSILGYDFLGFEIDKEYYDIACSRIENIGDEM